MRLKILFTLHNDQVHTETIKRKYVFNECQTQFIHNHLPGILRTEADKNHDDEYDDYYCRVFKDFHDWKKDILSIIDSIGNEDYKHMLNGSYKISINRDISYRFLEYLLKMCDYVITTINKESDNNPEYTICYFYQDTDADEGDNYFICNEETQIKTFDILEWKDNDDNFQIPEALNLKNVIKIFAEELTKLSDKM